MHRLQQGEAPRVIQRISRQAALLKRPTPTRHIMGMQGTLVFVVGPGSRRFIWYSLDERFGVA
jgi:hypothetical protein